MSALQGGSIKTYQQLNTRESEIRKSVYGDGDNKELKECREELEKMGKEAELTFAKQEDRQTIQNAYSANQDLCREEGKEKREEYIKEKDELEKQIGELRQKLQ